MITIQRLFTCRRRLPVNNKKQKKTITLLRQAVIVNNARFDNNNVINPSQRRAADIIIRLRPILELTASLKLHFSSPVIKPRGNSMKYWRKKKRKRDVETHAGYESCGGVSDLKIFTGSKMINVTRFVVLRLYESRVISIKRYAHNVSDVLTRV